MSTSQYQYDDSLDDDLQKRPTFEQALESLSQSEGNLPDPNIIAGFSGLTESQYEAFHPVWSGFDVTSQRIFMQTLADISESTFEFDFTTIARANLTHADAAVRQAAIEVLHEDLSPSLMNQLIKLAEADQNHEVRAEATKALGRYILAGEVGDLSESDTKQAQKVMIDILQSPDESPIMHRQALESLANCSNPKVKGFIQAAYDSNEDSLRIGAVKAMGHTCDSHWSARIIDELESDDPEMRIAAVHAAGELQLSEAIPLIGQVIVDGERDAVEVCIWALGEIGSKEALRILEALAEAAEEQDDDDLLDLIDEAMGNASLATGDDLFDMFEFEPDDDSDEYIN